MKTIHQLVAEQQAQLLSIFGPPAEPSVKSYKAEVIADNSGQWVGNGLRFASVAEAEAYVRGLASRWTLVRDTRVVPCDDPVTHAWVGGRLVDLPEEEALMAIPYRMWWDNKEWIVIVEEGPLKYMRLSLGEFIELYEELREKLLLDESKPPPEKSSH